MKGRRTVRSRELGVRSSETGKSIMLSILRKILEYLSWAVLGVLILTVALVMWGSWNGWEFDAVLSGSMEPVYNVGGLVIIRPVDPEALKIGDAISFKLPDINTPICHRIINIQYQDGQKYFQTKGDANEEADQNLVPLTSVGGKAIFHAPYVGRLGEVRNLGATKVSLLGTKLPLATFVIFGMGLLFIGLTMRDTLEDVFFPSKKMRREMGKKHSLRQAKRRERFKI
jgi:signal peptidase I